MGTPKELQAKRLRQISVARTLILEANTRLQQLPPPSDSEIKSIMQKTGDAYFRLGIAAGIYRFDSDSPDVSFVRPDPILDGKKVVPLASYREATSDATTQWQEPVRLVGAPDKPVPLPITRAHDDDNRHISRPPQVFAIPLVNGGKDFRSVAGRPGTGRSVLAAIDRAEELPQFTPISKPGLYRLTQLIEFANPDLLKRIELELTPERVAQFAAIRTFIKTKDPEVETKLKKTTADVLRRLREFLRDPEAYLQRCTDVNEAQLLKLLQSLTVKPVSRSQFLEHAATYI